MNGLPSMPDDTTIRTGLQPGDIGNLIALHGELYARDAGFDHTFEAYVATTVGEFFESYDPACDRLWVVERDSEMLGSLALKGRTAAEAQLRYFLLHPSLRGRGLGRRLMELLIAFARETGYTRIFLLTDEDHTAAATHLYLAYGFRLSETRSIARWGMSTAEQRYDLEL